METLDKKKRIVELLKNTVCEVTFTKANGDSRTGTFTLKNDIVRPIMEQEESEGKKPQKPLAEDSPTIRALEITADAEQGHQWRSFVTDRVTEFKYLDTYSNLWITENFE